jgi:hypothetical protein
VFVASEVGIHDEWNFHFHGNGKCGERNDVDVDVDDIAGLGLIWGLRI